MPAQTSRHGGDVLQQAAVIVDAVERARVLGEVIAEHQDVVWQAAAMRLRAITEAHHRGLGVKEIAEALGVAPARVWKMLHSR